jgi:hypothetical protein
MTNSGKIFINVGDEQIELTGSEKDKFLAQKALDQQEETTIQEAKELRQAQKIAVLNRLGLTAEELAVLLG